MDLREAYKIMDVTEEINLVELEEKYLLWIRRAKEQHQKGTNQINMDKITKAYETIKDHLQRLEEGPDDQPKSPFREKLEHIQHYYKFHIIGAILALVIAGYMIHSFVENRQEQARIAALPPIDLEILMFGEYLIADISPMFETIYAQFPDWERVEVNFLYAPSEVRSEFDIGTIQKNAVTIMNEKPDIYIMDLHHFQMFSENPPFQPFDDFFEINDLTTFGSERLFFQQLEGEDEDNLFGLDIAGSYIFDELALEGKEMIAAFRRDSENQQNAIEFMRSVIEDLD